MGYGLGIFLMALGLILALAVDATLVGIDLQMIGWILAGAGLLVLVVTAVQLNAGRSRRSVVREPGGYGSPRGGSEYSGPYRYGTRSHNEGESRSRPPYA